MTPTNKPLTFKDVQVALQTGKQTLGLYIVPGQSRQWRLSKGDVVANKVAERVTGDPHFGPVATPPGATSAFGWRGA